MRKKLAILIITILSVSMMLTGCMRKSPSNVVDAYFKELKSGKQADRFLTNPIFDEDEEDTDEIMDETLKLYMSKIEAKVLSEEVNEDSATVEVEVNGPNLANMMLEVMGESIVDAFSGKDVDDDYMNRSLLEKVKEGESETRTGKVNLTKEDKKWKIEDDDDLMNLLLGDGDYIDSLLGL